MTQTKFLIETIYPAHLVLDVGGDRIEFTPAGSIDIDDSFTDISPHSNDNVKLGKALSHFSEAHIEDVYAYTKLNIPQRTANDGSPAVGDIWLRTDL